MANFTTESNVREKFQLIDTTLAPSDLIERSIDDAHIEILRFLDPDFDVDPPDEALTLGETLLSGAHTLRSLATRDAVEQKRLSVGGKRVEEGRRFDLLMHAAEAAENHAWRVLEPFLVPRTAQNVLAVTDTQPILEED